MHTVSDISRPGPSSTLTFLLVLMVVFSNMTLSRLLLSRRAGALTSAVGWRAISSKPTIAIRREDNSVWERRAPLAPADVRQIVRENINVVVQPSNRRAFPMEVRHFVIYKCMMVHVAFSFSLPLSSNTDAWRQAINILSYGIFSQSGLHMGIFYAFFVFSSYAFYMPNVTLLCLYII